MEYDGAQRSLAWVLAIACLRAVMTKSYVKHHVGEFELSHFSQSHVFVTYVFLVSYVRVFPVFRVLSALDAGGN